MANTIPFFMTRMLLFPPLAGFLTWYCIKIGLIAHLTVVATIFFGGIFFAFAITINTANLRRFQAIDELAQIWATMMSIWVTAKRHLPEEKASELQNELREFFEKLRPFLHIETTGEESKKKLAEIDNFFNVISLTIEELRKGGVQPPEIARWLGWMENIIIAFEKLLAIKENRTPKSLRFFIDWTLVVGVLLLSPQFAEFGVYGIWISIIIMMVLLVLIKVQKMLEHPFGKDMDDIDLRLKEKAWRRIS